MTKLYYVDTCVWLNLFKKEGDLSKGLPYWKLAENFIEKTMKSPDMKIAYSGIILRELQIILEEEYNKKRKFFEEDPLFLKIELLPEDKTKARILESQYQFKISFYDLLHMMVCKRLSMTLITRDNQLLRIAKENKVTAMKQEQL